MAARLDGKVAFVTGAGRGQGRSHAIRLAQEGARIIAVDICRQIGTVPYPLATPEDLAQTVKEVETVGQRIVAREADVRDEAALKAAFAAGVAELGPVDIVLANAGIAPVARGGTHDAWRDVIDVNLTGVFNTVETAIPSMIERGEGGAIVLISSTAGITGIGGPNPGGLGYTAAKHGGVRTPMIMNDAMQQILSTDARVWNEASNALPVDMIEPADVSNAIVWLVSDDARYVTGVVLPVDAGFSNKK
jgi:NAD(P)-dependent dehydrogenase (short-subunit alcohol dehydrogenase family)